MSINFDVNLVKKGFKKIQKRKLLFNGDIMLRVYMLIIVVGLIGGVVYGAYAYYNDTQQN